MFAFGQEDKERDGPVSTFCGSLTCHIISRIYIRAIIRFAHRWIAWRMGVEVIKATCLFLRLYLLIYFLVKFTAVIPHRKLWFLSFVKHFEALPFFLLLICSLSFYPHWPENLNCLLFRDLSQMAGRIVFGRSTRVCIAYSFFFHMVHPFVHLLSFWNMTYDFSV